MTELKIIPECYVDTKVAEISGQAKRYNHAHGCGDVANYMIKSKNIICLGIIDEDLKKGPSPRYFSEFELIREENNLKLKKHKVLKQYLILICPEIERWLMNDAIIVQVEPTDKNYDLPANLKGFKSICKTQNIDKNIGFNRFVKSLVNKNAPSVSTLKSWITLFMKGELDILRDN
jgi:hypothetical protein